MITTTTCIGFCLLAALSGYGICELRWRLRTKNAIRGIEDLTDAVNKLCQDLSASTERDDEDEDEDFGKAASFHEERGDV